MRVAALAKRVPASGAAEAKLRYVRRFQAKVYVLKNRFCQNWHASRRLSNVYAVDDYVLGRRNENREKRDVFRSDPRVRIRVLAGLIHGVG
jgi:hypothetical protein